MHNTDPRAVPRALAGLVAAAALLGAAACAADRPAARDEAPSVAVPSPSLPVPARLVALLDHNETQVHAVDLTGVGLDAAAAIATFVEHYGNERWPGPPTAYGVEIDRSVEARLPAGTTAWMLHIARVPREVRPPLDVEGGSTPAATTVETDLFAFVDARSGALLLTTYLADSGT